MTEPRYTGRDLQAVQMVLTELRQLLGEYWLDGSLVVIGGCAPWLLCQDAQPAHVGTIDLDLLLDPARLSGGRYAQALRTLESRGYQLPPVVRTTSADADPQHPFQLRREIDLADGSSPVLIVVDLMMPLGAQYARNRPALVPGLRVQGASGGQAALLSNVEVVLHGQMPGGVPNTVRIPVASPEALLVMKAYALAGRDKAKDAYDIVFLIRHALAGGLHLAAACHALEQRYPEATGAYRQIAEKFLSVDSYGPSNYAAFMTGEGLDEGQSRAFHRRDAFSLVGEWVTELEEIRRS